MELNNNNIFLISLLIFLFAAYLIEKIILNFKKKSNENILLIIVLLEALTHYERSYNKKTCIDKSDFVSGGFCHYLNKDEHYGVY